MNANAEPAALCEDEQTELGEFIPLEKSPVFQLLNQQFSALSAAEQAQIRAEVYAECGLNAHCN